MRLVSTTRLEQVQTIARTERGGLRGRAEDGRRRRRRRRRRRQSPRVVGQTRGRPRLMAGGVTVYPDGSAWYGLFRVMLHPTVRRRLVRRTAKHYASTDNDNFIGMRRNVHKIKQYRLQVRHSVVRIITTIN